jgi:hypothetical protein
VGKAKPFCIAKREVWMAYKQVKANHGAAGVDDQSIAEFEEDLRRNLYRIWNRMSSGSYFPPQVRRVDIPKGEGRTRPLGIPTVDYSLTLHGPNGGRMVGFDNAHPSREAEAWRSAGPSPPAADDPALRIPGRADTSRRFLEHSGCGVV